MAGNDELTLAKLLRSMQSIVPKEAGKLGNSKVDALAVVAFIETLCLVKYAIFLIEQGLCILMPSDNLLLNAVFSKLKGSVMQAVILNTTIASGAHLGKTVLCPCKEIHVKGKDELPGWLITAAKR